MLWAFFMSLMFTWLVLVAGAWMAPGLLIVGVWSAVILSVVISVAFWLVELLLRPAATTALRGLVAFIVAFLVIYATPFLVTTVSVTFFGALAAAFFIGVITALVPTRHQVRNEYRGGSAHTSESR